MIQLSPKVVDLSDVDTLWVQPGEQITMLIDFERDVSSATHVIEIEEYQWPYMPSTYDELVVADRNTFDTSEAVDGIVYHEIDSSTTEAWNNRKFTLLWKVTLDGDTWVAASRTIAVAKGE